MAGSQKYSDEMTFKKVGPENIQTFWNHKKYWTRSVSTKVTRRMGDIQHVQWGPADMMQEIPIQRITHGNSTTTRYYQWGRKIWNMESQKTKIQCYIRKCFSMKTSNLLRFLSI